MEERGVAVAHSPSKRWGIKDRPRLEAEFQRRTRPVWGSWRMDATSITVQGEWQSLSRAGEKQGQTMDFLRPAPRAQEAARRLLHKAIRRPGLSETLTMDGSDAKAAAIKRYNGGVRDPFRENQEPALSRAKCWGER
jgi:putative transposase